MLKTLKTIQAAAVLLKEHNGCMSRLRLLKMLYMSDRIRLQTIGRTVTGDRPFAMDNGPVLTRVYDLIKGTDAETTTWEQFIKRQGQRDLVLCNDPGIDELSAFEIETLQKIAKDHEDKSDWDVADETHDFPEWIKNKPAKGESKKIPWDDVLEALNLLSLKDVLVEEAQAVESANKTLV
jgi:uncharacterized phage-associated protein